MSVTVSSIGEFRGMRVDEARMTSDTGVSLTIMNWGATLRNWVVPVAGGERPVVLGFDDFAPYPGHSPYFGAIVGRVANRITKARFRLDGKTIQLEPNEGANQLHGGPDGLSRQIWDMQVESAANSVRFTHTSPDGAMGYPGVLACEVICRLKANRLRIEFAATPDRPTPVNLVQHFYFNLGTGSDVLDHSVHLPSASAWTELGDELLPTGRVLPVDGTSNDFRRPRPMRNAEGEPVEYDLNFALDPARDTADPIAIITSPGGDLTLTQFSDQPGLQFYNGVTTSVSVPGRNGATYGKYSGFCIEDQKWPDALNHSGFPSIISTPDQPYSHWCEIEIS